MKLGYKYSLGDGENYFKIREDKYNSETLRSELFNKESKIIDKLLVKGGYTQENKTLDDVINYFEVSVMKKPL